MRLHEDTAVTAFDREEGGVVVRTEWGSVRADRVVLGTGAFRGPLKRLALWTLPVYDHVLMSEPLSAAQLDAVGWRGREGLTDAGNQFHYYRRTLDDRVLFGGYDANYHFPGRIDPRAGAVGRRTTCWRGTSSRSSPSSRACGSPTGGPASSTRRRASRRCSAPRSVAACRTPSATPGSGVASTRFGARVALDLVDGRDTEVTRLGMVRRKPMPFPPEPIRYAAVRATRASLAAEDRTGRRNLWLRGLDAAGVGFDS